MIKTLNTVHCTLASYNNAEHARVIL